MFMALIKKKLNPQIMIFYKDSNQNSAIQNEYTLTL